MGRTRKYLACLIHSVYDYLGLGDNGPALESGQPERWAMHKMGSKSRHMAQR